MQPDLRRENPDFGGFGGGVGAGGRVCLASISCTYYICLMRDKERIDKIEEMIKCHKTAQDAVTSFPITLGECWTLLGLYKALNIGRSARAWAAPKDIKPHSLQSSERIHINLLRLIELDYIYRIVLGKYNLTPLGKEVVVEISDQF